MVAPLIGAGLRMGAKKLAQKFGKKDEKKTSINLIEEAQKKEAEGKRRAQIESVKEGVKTAAKTTAKATGAAGGAGVMYLTAEDRATSGQGGPALDALRKIGKTGEEEKEPVKKKAGGKVHDDVKKDKPMMEKVAKKVVKGHEKRMHKTKKMMGGGMTYKKGGSIDGCATKGKTKGKQVKTKKMMGGGMTYKKGGSMK